MRQIQLIGTFLLIFFTFEGNSQSSVPLLDRNVALSFSEVPLQEALFTLSEQADFNLSFNSDVIPSGSIVSYDCKGKKLSEILPSILPQQVDVKTSGNNVILLKKSPKTVKKKEIIVHGKIIDKSSGEAIFEASILDIYSSQSVLTDSMGYFKLQLIHKKPELILSISKIGYKDTSVVLLPTSQTVKLTLTKEERPKIIQPEILGGIPIKNVEAYPIGKLTLPRFLLKHTENIQGYTRKKFQLSLTPGISTNLNIAGTVKNETSINLIGGYSYGVEGVEVGGLFNINRKDVSGSQIAGLTNLVGGEMIGSQIAGGLNRTKGKQEGTQIAGIGNFNSDDFSGLQLSAGFNLAINITGTQITAGANLADSISGVQVSAGFNKTKYLDGLQLNSGFNDCENMNGVQIGLVNRAGQQKGFQLGLVNISDTSEGFSIGILNFVKDRKFPCIGFSY